MVVGGFLIETQKIIFLSSVYLHPKLYTPSTIVNTSIKLLTKPFGYTQMCCFPGDQLLHTSSESLNLRIYINLDFNPEAPNKFRTNFCLKNLKHIRNNWNP